jgi:hypothetical protein
MMGDTDPIGCDAQRRIGLIRLGFVTGRPVANSLA